MNDGTKSPALHAPEPATVTVIVQVLAGKRLLLNNPQRGKLGSVIPSGTQAIGVQEGEGAAAKVYFPEYDGEIALATLRERWEAFIIEAHKRVGNDPEEELFTWGA